MTASGALAIEIKQAPGKQNASRSHLHLVYDKRRCEPQRKKAHRQTQNNQSTLVRLVVAFALIASIASAAMGSMRSDFVNMSLGNAHTKSVAIMPGDTLWTIAKRHAVEGVSTYDEVQWIRAQNDLSTGELQVGTRLVVPDTSY